VPLGDPSCSQARAVEVRDPLQQPLMVTGLLEAAIRPNSGLAWPTGISVLLGRMATERGRVPSIGRSARRSDDTEAD
jgi:hypothetical protein